MRRSHQKFLQELRPGDGADDPGPTHIDVIIAIVFRERNEFVVIGVYLLGNHISATTNRRVLLRLSLDFTQRTVPYCTRCAHGGFQLIDFIALPVLSIMGMI